MSENVNVEQQAPLRITVSEIKGLLNQGKSRKEIAEYYGKSVAEMQRSVWSNPKLKNLKAKKQYNDIVLEDDEQEEQVEQVDVNEIAHVPGPEANYAFENQEEMGTVATEEVEVTQPATADWN
jgi:hypothetical protein